MSNLIESQKQTSFIIDCKQVSKSFGTVKALDGFTANLSNGIWGLIGPNGAGKTTLIKILTGLLQKSSGEITILGYNFPKDELLIKNQLGFFFTNQSFPKSYSGSDYLKYIASCYQIPEELSIKLIQYIAQKLEFETYLERNIANLSSGTKQKIAIAQALVSIPKIAIMDEPFANIDPHIKIYAANLLKEFHEEFNCNFLISSHNLEDLSSFCTQFIFINNGKQLWLGNKDQIPDKDLVTFYMHLYNKG